MTTFGSAVKDALAKREMTVKSLSERSEISLSRLRPAIEGSAELSDAEAERVADELAVPRRALLGNSPLPLSVVPDFRRSSPRPGLYGKGTLRALAYVEKLSGVFSELPVNVKLEENFVGFDGPLTSSNAKRLAAHWRKMWGVTPAEQLEWQNAHAVYTSLRDFIEGTGVFVLHQTFGADDVSGVYTQIESGPHFVIINTTGSSKARKLFTLAHEFCHVLLGRSGASNTAVLNNKVERFCNKFAAMLLAPDDLMRMAIRRFSYEGGLGREQVRLFSKKIGISQHATALRLVEIGEATSSDYGAWKALFSGPIPPGDQADTPGGRSDPIKAKRTTYGRSLLRVLGEAARNEYLDELDIYYVSGIKPKFQGSLFGPVA